MDKALLTGISGFPEYKPNEQAIFDRMLKIIEDTYLRFGYLHIETPAVERKEILSAKGGNDKEIYALSRLAAAADEDPETDLALHFDLTVPLARYVAMRQKELVFPFRRYQIQKVWRGERAQAGKGRYREFYQCDIDIVGREKLGLASDAEVPFVINEIFSKLTAEFSLGKFVIRINNRRIVQGFLEQQGISSERVSPVLSILDGAEKTTGEELGRELATVGISDETAKSLVDFIKIRGRHDAVLDQLSRLEVEHPEFKLGLEELKEVVNCLVELKTPMENFEIDLGVIRGLEYYTGTVYETQLTKYPKFGSVCSGGRYENLASYFSDTKLPGVGISIGATRLFAGLLEAKAFQATNNLSSVLVTVLDRTLRGHCFTLAQDLRQAGIACEVYLEPRRLKDQLEYGNKKGHLACLIVGGDEFSAGNVQIKVMQSGEAIVVPYDQVGATIKGLMIQRQ